MRVLTAIVLAATFGGCTSVKMVQRDGCWVRRTEKIFGQVREEIGPCARTASPWSEDRLTRLVQECVAREDYRWQMRALAAFGRNEPMPRDHQANVLATCTTDAARAGFAENDALKHQLAAANERLSGAKERISDVAGDRDALRKRSELEQDRMYASNQKLADALAEAAKKPSAPAVATATASSDGRARMDAEERRQSAAPQTAPVALVNAPWMAAPAQPAAAAPRPRGAKKAVAAAKPVECAPPGGAAPAAAPGGGTAVAEAGTAVTAPTPGQVVKAADDKPGIGPAPAAAKE